MRSRNERPRFSGLQILLALLPAVLLLFLAPTGLYAELPGEALQVQQRVSVTSDVPTYSHDGELMLTTVSISPATAADAVASLLGGGDVVSAVDILGPQLDPSLMREENAALMRQSKENAVAVALQQLGYPVTIEEQGALVLAVREDWPARGLLEEGDIITAANQQPVRSAADVTSVVGAIGPGGQVTFELLRQGGSLTVTLQTRASTQSPERGAVGVVIQDKVLIGPLPLGVEIETGNIGGPSAGLMMSLAVMDVLSPESLSGGKRVAGTGEISPRGDVGPIGGINLKIRAAQEAGAVAFILPAGNLDQVEMEAVHIPIYPVADIAEALRALEEIRAGSSI